VLRGGLQKPRLGGLQQFLLVSHSLLKQSDEQHRQFVGMRVVDRHGLSEHPFEQSQVFRPEKNIRRDSTAHKASYCEVDR
jgi:hypothetical protein